MSAYGASPTKRTRRTNVEIAELDEAIISWVDENAPVSGRGTFYGCSTRGVVPKSEAGYKAVLRRLLVLRRDGRVDYEDVTDGTRWISKPTTYDGWQDAIEDAARSYRRALWSRSPVAVNIFSEKDAISGVILPITDRWDVALGVLRGYSSETFAYGVAATLDPRRHNVLAQLGDHDPSGVGAWADFSRKVAEFKPAISTEFVRLAVTPGQIDEFDLPTRPTKRSDTRSRGWIGGSVEVDAIPASTIRTLVDDFISSYVDEHELEVLRNTELEERKYLRGLPAMLGAAS